MNVYIENESNRTFDFSDWREVIENAARTALFGRNIPDNADINVLVTDSESIRRINRENRGVDSETDVLSFPYFEFASPGVFEGTVYEDGENILGDIILCADRVISQAASYGHSQRRETAFLTVHSALHIIGYDHENDEDGALMRDEEKRLMEILDIPR